MPLETSMIGRIAAVKVPQVFLILRKMSKREAVRRGFRDRLQQPEQGRAFTRQKLPRQTVQQTDGNIESVRVDARGQHARELAGQRILPQNAVPEQQPVQRPQRPPNGPVPLKRPEHLPGKTVRNGHPQLKPERKIRWAAQQQEVVGLRRFVRAVVGRTVQPYQAVFFEQGFGFTGSQVPADARGLSDQPDNFAGDR
ncbi:hypothetical protein CYPRO_2212 [Cyclonatronum proteinivorum]|uniref:Uncharacterized protein n=1 Tax=Cyclonatronum proteinivorum TaxID=1457365 RepID=A0A345ULV8_9BACT|nr:hypothetical protein CYPRO_2212 [Cyclonatronum proteinivorum]